MKRGKMKFIDLLRKLGIYRSGSIKATYKSGREIPNELLQSGVFNSKKDLINFKKNKEKEYKVHPEVKIGHIHLTVFDLEASLRFYKDLLGFEITQNLGHAVFLSAGGYHHHIGLNTWSKPGAKKPETGHIGLYHFAILYPNRKELSKVLRRLIEAKYPIDGASDHGVSEAIYLRDPDKNGIELYVDRDKKLWRKNKDKYLSMGTDPLDIKGLLKESE